MTNHRMTKSGYAWLDELYFSDEESVPALSAPNLMELAAAPAVAPAMLAPKVPMLVAAPALAAPTTHIHKPAAAPAVPPPNRVVSPEAMVALHDHTPKPIAAPALPAPMRVAPDSQASTWVEFAVPPVPASKNVAATTPRVRYTAIKSPPARVDSTSDPVEVDSAESGSDLNEDIARPPAPELGEPATHLNDWKMFQVNLHRYKGWWELQHGIIDITHTFMDSRTAAEGIQLRNANLRCRSMICQKACEFKIGMARSMAARWNLYRSWKGQWSWTPTHLCIVLKTRSREAVGFAEAALIDMLRREDQWLPYNRNAATKDIGGTGPRKKGEENEHYFVYLALRARREAVA